MTRTYVEGWTEPIRDQLLDGATAPNMTGMEVELLLYVYNKSTGEWELKDYEGTSGFTTASEAKAYFHPAPTDLLASESPYRARYKVTDGNGDDSFFPQHGAMNWVVQKP